MKSLPSPHRASCLAVLPRVLVLTVTAISVGWCLKSARDQVSERSSFARDMARVAIVAPDTQPAVDQQSIDTALVMFGIEVPASAEHPQLDRELKDRGLTTRGAFMEKSKVTVGPAAFASWSLLGSTLAHELEVHCQQNFLFISLMDALRLDGTGEAERQAYAHELRNAKRFGLHIADADLIASTMEYYYPDSVEGRTGAGMHTVRRWLARNFIMPPSRL